MRGRSKFEKDMNWIKVKSKKVRKDKRRIEVTGEEVEGCENRDK